MLQSTAYGTELFSDGQPGPGITSERKTVLEKNFCKWVEKAADFDDKVASTFHVYVTFYGVYGCMLSHIKPPGIMS